jgi:hypothetical protein
MNKQKTIAEIVREMTPEQAAKEAHDLRAFLDDENSSTNPKDWIWLKALEQRAKGKEV